MMKLVSSQLTQSVTPGRIEAVMRVGFTERQARFLVHVLVFSGVFIERQYRAFTGLERYLPNDWYPHRTFGKGAEKTTRFFPDKLPIGVPLRGDRRHLFLYLATREVPSEFRVFLLRHADLLKSVPEWTIRVLLPRRFHKAASLYRYAVRDAFLMPLTPQYVQELEWYFRARQGDAGLPPDADLNLTTASRKFSAARYEALYRVWQQRGVDALRAMQIDTLRDALQRGWGRLEFADLPRQYLQLTPLSGTAGEMEIPPDAGDNLAFV